MAGKNMWGLEMAVLLLGLLAMVQSSMQNPLPLRPRNIKLDETPAFGIITTSNRIAKELNESSSFVHTSSVEILGKTFMIGTIYGTPVVFTKTSPNPSVNTAIIAQMMVQNFNVQGLVHLGRAGASNTSMEVGTVSVPKELAFTGSWEWLKDDANQKGELIFSYYNRPANGKNLLGSVKYKQIDVLYKRKVIKTFYVYASGTWLNYASRVKIDSGDVVVGLKSSTSDIYVDNPQYANFIHKEFGASTLDTTGASVGLTSKANAVKFISIQGVSNKAGSGHATPSDKELASQNVVKALIRFIWEATVPRYATDQ